ncbi:MAG TPA: hypothetical protein PKC59_09755 [Burkholderiaceae bacterium]|nr:hypothetical protein [Burkholderiaceae bacterium]HNB42864.1 hypothetical protein [Burkholderiaceae bacterium]HNG78102.1 hypothetical protein [Burkholderiaceae bacterium]
MTARTPGALASPVLLMAAALLTVAPGAAPAADAGAGGAEPTVEALCRSLYPASWRPIEGQHLAPVPESPRPAKGVAVTDPVHRTCVLRVTDHVAEASLGAKGFLRNDYSRRQAFNANNTRLIAIASDGHWHLYDASTLRHLRQMPHLAGDAEPQWHPTDPDKLYFVPNNGVGMALLELDVVSGQERTVANFASRLRAKWPQANTAWTKSEGSPSADGRYWCFMVDDAKWQGVGLFTWDRDTDSILGMRDLNGVRPDHVSMSPGGSHCVVSGTGSQGTVAWTRDFASSRRLHNASEHSDLALNTKGEDVYVAIDYQSSGGAVFMVNLQTGERTDLFRTYLNGTATALHISGKAFNKPGWVLVSTYADYAARGNAGQQWPHRKLFAMSLDAKPRFVNLAHHHSVFAKYWTEPQASVNRDFTRVVFNSNWGVKSETDVDMYLVALPPNLLSAR